jgi:enterochelin esterase-like enzyme
VRRPRGLVVFLIAVAAVTVAAFAHRGVNTRGAKIERYTIHSRLVGADLRQIGIRTGSRRPLVVLLHGRGSGPESWIRPQLFDALHALGHRAPDLLLADGDTDSYYHDRRSGKWGSYVLREAIPAGIHKLGADGSRVAIGGISMGGFGALDLARLHPGRFCAVGGHSPALWTTGGATAPGAFDDAEDFARHDVVGTARPRRVYRIPVWLDAGTEDPFRGTDAAFAGELRGHGTQVSFHTSPGGHDWTYWGSQLAAYLRFYARALRSCA